MWILVEQVTELTAAQILALHSTPVKIVNDPGDGNIAVLVACSVIYRAGTTPYAGAATLGFLYDGGGAALAAGSIDLSDPEDQISLNIGATADGPLEDYVGAVNLSAASNPTIGNGTISVLAKYYVHPV